MNTAQLATVSIQNEDFNKCINLRFMGCVREMRIFLRGCIKKQKILVGVDCEFRFLIFYSTELVENENGETENRSQNL